MECIASIAGLHTPHLAIGCAISPVRIGGRRKQSAVKIIKGMRASQSRYSCAASLYEILSVTESASARDIKSAYRRMALKYHPDVSPPEEKEERTRKFLEVQEAYDTLADPLLRQDYDWRLHNMFAVGECPGRLENHVWEAQLMELIRRRSANKSSWGSTIRTRNQHAAASASPC